MDNRATILDCALDLFSRLGYDGSGVQEICEAAGITKPTLYHYFGSKQGLLKALLAQYSNDFHARLKEAADYQGDLPFTLRKIATTCFSFAIQQPRYYRFQLALWFTPHESEAYQATAELNEIPFHLLEQVFIKAVTQHGNMRNRHTLYAVTFLGMINNLIGLYLNGLLPALDEPLIQRALHQFEHGIYS